MFMQVGWGKNVKKLGFVSNLDTNSSVISEILVFHQLFHTLKHQKMS